MPEIIRKDPACLKQDEQFRIESAQRIDPWCFGTPQKGRQAVEDGVGHMSDPQNPFDGQSQMPLPDPKGDKPIGNGLFAVSK